MLSAQECAQLPEPIALKLSKRLFNFTRMKCQVLPSNN